MFNQLTASWPVKVEDGGYVRLYDRNGNLLALVSEPQRIRTIFFDPDGTVLEEQVLLEHPWINIEPRTAVLASLPDGSQYLGLVSDKTAQLMAVDPQGVPLNQEHNLLWDVAETIPDFDLSAPLGSFTLGRISGDGLVDNLTVTSEGGPLIQNDFTSDDLTGWTRFERDPEGPELCGSGDEDPECEYVFVPVTTENAIVEGGQLAFTATELVRDIEGAWNSFEAQVDVRMDHGLVLRASDIPFANDWGPGFTVFGGFPNQLQMVELRASNSEFLTLEVHVAGGDRNVNDSFSNRMGFPFLNGISYTLRLELDGGLARATLYPEQPLFVDEFSDPLAGDRGIVVGEIALTNTRGSCLFDNLVVSSGGRVRFSDDFENGDLDGWNFVSSSTKVEGGRVFIADSPSVATRIADTTWQDLRVEVDIGAFDRGMCGLRLDSPERTPSSSFALILWSEFDLVDFVSSELERRIREQHELILLFVRGEYTP